MSKERDMLPEIDLGPTIEVEGTNLEKEEGQGLEEGLEKKKEKTLGRKNLTINLVENTVDIMNDIYRSNNYLTQLIY